MNIYVDFDDCICETARHFSGFVNKLFGIEVPYENMRFFDLQQSFSLNQEQFEYMMSEAHKPKVLLSYDETPGAVDTLNDWIESGHNVSVITGRPFSAYEPSRLWLDNHGLEKAKLYCLNKYGRENFFEKSEFSLEINDYLKMHFDIAVEDSPLAFRFFDHLPNIKVMVYDRPWNHEFELADKRYHRCKDWEEIRNEINET